MGRRSLLGVMVGLPLHGGNEMSKTMMVLFPTLVFSISLAWVSYVARLQPVKTGHHLLVDHPVVYVKHRQVKRARSAKPWSEPQLIVDRP